MRQWFRCAPLVLCLVTACAGSAGGGGNSTGGASLGQGSESQAPAAKLPPAPPGYTATAYPIVLIPGFLGFTKLAGTVEYFSGVADTLEASGAKVYQVTVSQASDSITRGAEVIPQLEAIKTMTGATKLNLIGHSQGGLDARYIAAVRPDLVASVTGVGSPNTGTPVAANIEALPIIGTGAVQALADFFALLSGSKDPNDAKACLTFLSPKSMIAFNAAYPAALPTASCGTGAPVVNGISYYSWGGVDWLTNPFDLLDPIWILLGMQIGGGNDGLVPKCGSHLGTVIRDDYPYNHIDEANMIFGLVGPFAPNPLELYRVHANRLKLAGL
jgi:triacylglycerol lipase